MWTPIGNFDPTVIISKKGGLSWNVAAHIRLGRPEWVSLWFDSDTHKVAIGNGNDFFVQREDGTYFIDAKSALEQCGLIFPLQDDLALSFLDSSNADSPAGYFFQL